MAKQDTPQEENDLITLTDEHGEDFQCEYLDCIGYAGKEYLVMMPADEKEVNIVILEVLPGKDGSETYLAVEDQTVLDHVYDEFKERYKNELTFED